MSDTIFRSTAFPVAQELPKAVAKRLPSLKKIPPYWYPYRTNAKARWFDREILEIVSTEFRDRSVEYYSSTMDRSCQRYALQSGVTTVNGKIALPGTIVRNGDTLENIVHRHEPPVTSTQVEILYHDTERHFIVINKPGSIPVHAAGRYFKNSLVEILKTDFGFKNVYTVNRLDRLTSGLMIIALSAECARILTAEFASGTIGKEYMARVRGQFPAEEVVCDQPLLTIDRQMGLNVVHPDGKEALTVFNRVRYDQDTDTSVVHCRPYTGRSHQIRVHLQFLGHPIANDSVYAETKIWGTQLGRGGIDLAPSDIREAPRPPEGFETSTAEGKGRETGKATIADLKPVENEDGDPILDSSPLTPWQARKARKTAERMNNPAFRTKEESAQLRKLQQKIDPENTLLPRESGHDIGMGSPVPLSDEAVGIITRLRNQKDEDEDWSRWRDIVFRARGALAPHAVREAYAQQHRVPPKSNRKKKGKGSGASKESEAEASTTDETVSTPAVQFQPDRFAVETDSPTAMTGGGTILKAEADKGTTPQLSEEGSSDALYCPECYLPLHPDPAPEKLYIFLHALRYTSASLGAYETALPEWAAPDYIWQT